MAQKDIVGSVLRLIFQAEVSCEISPVNWLYKLSCRYGTQRSRWQQINLSRTYGAERYRWQRVKINILVGGILQDISSKLAREIFPLHMAQRDIVGSVLRVIFQAEVSCEISTVNWPDKSCLQIWRREISLAACVE